VWGLLTSHTTPRTEAADSGLLRTQAVQRANRRLRCKTK